jgi:leucyl/phenylalanyl-tRNA--protein transferase
MAEPDGEPVSGWTVDRHLALYQRGFFPMGDPLAYPFDGREVRWHQPEVRAVLPLTNAAGLHVPRTIARELRRSRFDFRTDTAFRDVILGCAQPRGPIDLPWVCGRLVAMFTALHAAGHAHSFEAWRRDPDTGDEALVGGVCGLSIGAAFFAESMFHIPRPRRPDGSRHPLDGTNASSCALVALCQHLDRCGYKLLDIQMTTDHTARFGATDVNADDFLERLAQITESRDCWRPFDDEAAAAGSA